MHQIKWRCSDFKQFMFMDATISVSTHKRSNSDMMKRRRFMEDELENISEDSYQSKMEVGELSNNIESKKKQYHDMDLQKSLTQEILQLKLRLQQQVVIRRALEKACYLPFSLDAAVENSIPKAAKELIKEIGILELEVVYLEQYLLSLYRKRYDQQISSPTTNERRSELDSDASKETSAAPDKDAVSDKEISVIHSKHLISHSNLAGSQLKECNNQLEPESVLGSSIHRCYSELSQRTVCSIEASSPVNIKTKSVDYYHSLPLSMLEQTQDAKFSSTSLAEHLGNCYDNDVPETPNWLSEEMIKCISALYCELSEPTFLGHKNASPPLRFTSSGYESSKWGSQWKKHSAFNLNSSRPFHVKGSKEFNEPYFSMMRIQQLCTDNQKLKENEYMLRRYRSLVSRLVDVNPRYMKHEEKLAFWINVHNALAMHALLIYGISTNNVKRMSSVLKAAYNIGGHTISIELIQNFILGCRLPSPTPGQWLRLWFPSKTKTKVRDGRKGYAIHHPEPLLLFALSSGSHSDPAVRLYTPKGVFEELELAKEEYIKSTITITKEQKLVLPKIVDSFAKFSGHETSDLMEIVKPYLHDSQRKSIQDFRSKTSCKGIELAPHNFTFHYLISKELAW